MNDKNMKKEKIGTEIEILMDKHKDILTIEVVFENGVRIKRYKKRK